MNQTPDRPEMHQAEPLGSSDNPVRTLEEDRLEWAPFALNLARWIEGSAKDTTWVVGVHGPWGSGKSSFMNLVERQLENLERELGEAPPLVFHFQPWLFSGAQDLVVAFCRELSAFLHQNSGIEGKADQSLGQVAALISQYGSALTLVAVSSFSLPGPAKGIPLVGLVKFLVEAVKHWNQVRGQGVATPQALRQKIRSELQTKRCRIVVAIDDLDRLQHSELVQVFQLVRAVADFPNLVYLLGYDLEVIKKSLGEVQKGDPEEYLEKIVNFSVRVPSVSIKARRDQLTHLVLEAFRGKDLSKSQVHVASVFEYPLIPACNTLRDVKRFGNYLRWWVGALGVEEIDPGDLVILALIQTVAPSIWEILPQILSASGRNARSLITSLAQAEKSEDELRRLLRELPSVAGISWKYVFESVDCLGLLETFPNNGPIDGRLRSTNNFRRILELVDAPDNLSNAQVKSWLDACRTIEQAFEIFQIVQGRGQAEQFLLLIHPLLPDATIEILESIAGYILQHSDRFASAAADYSGSQVQDLFGVLRLVLRELQKKDSSRPSKIIREGIEQSEDAFLQPLKLLRGDNEGRSPTSSLAYEFGMVENEVLALQDYMLRRIEERSGNGSLYRSLEQRFIAHTIRQWDGIDAARQYVERLFSVNDEGLLQGLAAFAKNGFSWTDNSSFPVFRRSIFGDFVDLDGKSGLFARAEKLRSSSKYASLTKWQRELLVAFLEIGRSAQTGGGSEVMT